jgi:GNAT superfamily N-acetyltransferase
MYKIEKVSPDVVHPLRHKVLRPHLPLEASCYQSDNDLGVIHFTLKMDDTILSIASLYSESAEAMPNKNAYRLRGMATEPSEQRKGFGAMVLHGAIDHLKKKTDVEILWCNARITAFGFYEKMGFKILGEIFDIPNLGPHKTGYIKL